MMLNDFAYSASRGERSFGERLLHRLHMDGPLLLAIVVLAMTGLAILYGASNQDAGMVYRQAIRLAVSFVVLLAVAQISPQFLRLWSPWLFALGLVLLLFTLHSGHIGRGAQRWLSFGVVRIQPSEIMKIAVPMMVAWYLHEKPLPPNWKQLFPLAAMIF
ncbi:MAG: FtsW/RodA/SpoVE family cell cycle protein, partial [Gammaproteobacteria bacterium]